jgi:hypothetical protein
MVTAMAPGELVGSSWEVKKEKYNEDNWRKL